VLGAELGSALMGWGGGGAGGRDERARVAVMRCTLSQRQMRVQWRAIPRSRTAPCATRPHHRPDPCRLLELVAVYYGVAAAVGVFAAVCAALLAGFLAYQCWLIGSGATAYETAKIRDLIKVQGGGGGGGNAAAFGWAGRGPYDRGSVFLNFKEVLFPDAFMREAVQRRQQREEEWQREREAAAAARERGGGSSGGEEGGAAVAGGGDGGGGAVRRRGVRRA